MVVPIAGMWVSVACRIIHCSSSVQKFPTFSGAEIWAILTISVVTQFNKLFFFFFFFKVFTYLWPSWVFTEACRLSLGAATRGYTPPPVPRHLLAVASFVAEHRL